MAETPALLERNDAFVLLDAELERSLLGSGRIAVVAGAAGIGKSSLARAFTHRHAGEMRVLWGACDALFTPRPLAPVREIARTLDGVPTDAPTSLDERNALFAAIVEELRTQPTIAVLDDMHRADGATVAAVEHLAANLDGAPVLLVLTLDSATPMEVPRASARVFLWPLSPSAVDELAERAERTTHGLYDATGGNPFFVTEVLAGESGDVPATAEEAVLARTRRLSPGAQRLLEAAAVVPGSAEVWLLQAIADEDFVHLAECLSTETLVPADAGIGFRHELARTAVEHTLESERRTELNEAVLQALAMQPEGAVDPARMAHHADAAGEADEVLHFAPLAACEAARVGAHPEAAEHYARALSYHQDADRRRLALLEGYVDQMELLGRLSEAEDARAEAAKLTREHEAAGT